MAQINHVITKTGRKIDWGGKAYNSFGELFQDGVSFDDYAKTNKVSPAHLNNPLIKAFNPRNEREQGCTGKKPKI